MRAEMTSLHDILSPSVEAMGYELLLLEQTQVDKQAVLRVYIDAPGGIMLEDCEQVSHQISLILDLEDPIHTAYALEVTSPGLDRPLVKNTHFKSVLNQHVRVQTHDYILGRRRFKGQLLEASKDTIVVVVDGEDYTIPYSSIDSARLVPEFTDI